MNKKSTQTHTIPFYGQHPIARSLSDVNVLEQVGIITDAITRLNDEKQQERPYKWLIVGHEKKFKITQLNKESPQLTKHKNDYTVFPYVQCCAEGHIYTPKQKTKVKLNQLIMFKIRTNTCWKVQWERLPQKGEKTKCEKDAPTAYVTAEVEAQVQM